jgi:hypothetical protein
MTRIMASRHEVAAPELSRLQPRLVARSGDGRDDILPTPLPGIGNTNTDKKTRAESLRLLHVSRPSNGLPTSRPPTSTNTSPSRTRVAGWPSTRLPPGHRGDGGRDDGILAHCPRVRRVEVASTSTSTLHRQLERLQSVLHRPLPVPL